ncbi:hypothetical protein [Geodermatophilus amargosae]|uniref:hypothetical protein n=1 Tax=Geodermatophilus amargosae TaxID=1296565 RepID=UPI0034DFE865
MRWAVISVVGFLLLTGLVTWMARSNTARWERDHRAAQAAARARAETARSGWVAALTHHAHGHRAHGDGAEEHRPHLHLPHVHLPAGLVTRLPHPHLHLPQVHLPQVHLPWRSPPDEQVDEPPRAGADAGS